MPHYTTIEQVKQDLPDVLVIFQGKTYTGHTNGRKMDFCMVWVPELSAHHEFSWTAIQRAVNNNHSLRF